MQKLITMEKDWFKDWFASEEYLTVYNHRDSLDAQNLSDLIIKTINPSKGESILDAACGAGRHGLYLASNGFKVFGFDLSKTLLNKCHDESLKMGLELGILQADIRQIIFKEKFIAVLNLFTSFGYFDTDEENFRFVKRSYDFLKDDGFYVLDYFNKDYLENHLVPESKRNVDGLLINEKRYIENGRVIKEIVLTKGNMSKQFYESVRLYDKNFIVNKFSEIGFKAYKIFGDYNGGQYDEKYSPRLIIFFKK